MQHLILDTIHAKVNEFSKLRGNTSVPCWLSPSVLQLTMSDCPDDRISDMRSHKDRTKFPPP